ATHYFEKTRDAILNLDVAPTTGFTSEVVNGARIDNRGTELSLNINWVRSKSISLITNANWSRNRSKIINLSGVKNVELGGLGTVTNRVIVGRPFGVLFGGLYERDEDGNFVLNSNGFPVTSPEQGIIGDPNPDWIAGINNTF